LKNPSIKNNEINETTQQLTYSLVFQSRHMEVDLLRLKFIPGKCYDASCLTERSSHFGQHLVGSSPPDFRNLSGHRCIAPPPGQGG